jgi:hypothetical protein
LQYSDYGGASFYVAAGAVILDFDWLWSSTTYQICGRHENVYGEFSDMKMEYFVTDPKDIN